MKTLSLAALALTLFSCNVIPRVDVVPAYGVYGVDGSFGAATGGAPVVSQDLSTLGIDGSESGFGYHTSLSWLNFQLALSGFAADYSGSGTTTAAIGINGDSVAAGLAVDSTLDLSYMRTALTYDIFPGSTVDMGLGLALTALDLDLQLAETMSANTLSADEQIPLPELAFRASVNLGKVGIFGNVGWISGDYGDFDGEVLDLDLSARLRLFGSGKRMVGLGTIGYRYVDTNFTYDDGSDTIDLNLLSDGIYAGLSFSF